MSTAVWLHDGPVGSGPGAVRLPSETVREHVEVDGHRSHEEEFIVSQRVVSPVVDLPEETCPTCEGYRTGFKHCSTCGGKGTIRRLWHAVPQVTSREKRAAERTDLPLLRAVQCGLGRLVVVGYSDTQQVDGDWCNCDAFGPDATPHTHPELSWESVVMLDTPIATMRCPRCDGLPPEDYVNDPPFTACPDCLSEQTVPLQLAPGWNPSVELETP